MFKKVERMYLLPHDDMHAHDLKNMKLYVNVFRQTKIKF